MQSRTGANECILAVDDFRRVALSLAAAVCLNEYTSPRNQRNALLCACSASPLAYQCRDVKVGRHQKTLLGGRRFFPQFGAREYTKANVSGMRMNRLRDSPMLALAPYMGIRTAYAPHQRNTIIRHQQVSVCIPALIGRDEAAKELLTALAS